MQEIAGVSDIYIFQYINLNKEIESLVQITNFHNKLLKFPLHM